MEVGGLARVSTGSGAGTKLDMLADGIYIGGGAILLILIVIVVVLLLRR